MKSFDSLTRLPWFRQGLKNGLLRVVLALAPFAALAAFAASASADDIPDAPVILDFAPGGCLPSAEVCGDGIDQDCSGDDLACPPAGGGPGDADADGFATAGDCDDQDRKVYPGISVACSVSGCSTGTKQCQSNGAYSSCTCAALCEAKGGGRCYYVSALTGNNSNPGTFNQPLQTLAPISTEHPSNRFTLRAGDVVYLMSGVYGDTYTVGVWKQVFFLNFVTGTATAPVVIKAYPGAHPVIASNSGGQGFTILSANHMIIEGLEFSRNSQAGLFVGDSANVEMRNLWVHDTEGVDNDNLSGVYIVHVNDWSLHHSLIHDNYDRVNADTGGEKTENSRDMVVFRGGNGRVHHNTMFQTPPITASKTGGCLCLKHALEVPGATFEVDHNTFRNCWSGAIGSSSYGGRFHHNLIFDSTVAFHLRNHGDSEAALYDNIIEKNTVVRGTALYYNPSQILEYQNRVGSLIFRKNIVIDTLRYDTDNGGMVSIDPYGNDSAYNQVVPTGDMQIDNNCYWNTANSVQFGLYSATFGGGTGLGGLYSLSQWQQWFDRNSAVTDPQLDSNSIPQKAQCTGYGYQVP